MEPARWTDERIDERMAATDDKFDRTFDELRLLREEMRADSARLREEMRAGFAELRGEMSSGYESLRAETAAIRTDLAAFQRQVTLIVAAFGVGLLGVLGAGQL